MGDNPQIFACGQLSEKCRYCGALYFKLQETTTGKYTICCKEGKIRIESQQGFYPNFLIDLFSNPENPDYKHFHNFIRQYNNSLAFVSFGAKYIGDAGKGLSNRKAPYCLRVDGQIYHNIANNLYTDDDIDASYSQLYIMDS